MIPSSIHRIEKEDVPALHFPVEPVHLSDEHLRLRDANIGRAMQLGNLEHTKCRIVFRDSVGMKVVETTVWAFDAERIVLKKGISIPIDRVIEVDLL
ncbi:MAG TPA: hypothetical protein PL010_14435 [Flavobacteriales bacterium]|nr:hypothetical protein [Flavobacteriales bacterium]HMZ48559.1 hypothetical protein [Flavobacteriales bacterium]HNA32008.1 hypothetical protein [Flavobacteriales bacterium]HNE79888.1 hypothetical protein [Flavobacteriales bacterium]HNI05817.1 hypothetical protein [Flavobacteriales bacterium]